MRAENCVRKVWKLTEKTIEDRSMKIAQPMRVQNCSRKVWKVSEEVHRRSLQENFPTDARASKIVQGRFWKLTKKSIEDRCRKNFPTDARRKLLKEGFGSWRRSPSKIAERKFPNRCASKIAQARFWKLAKKSIEDRCKKISQPMRVENCSRKVLEVVDGKVESTSVVCG